MVKSLLALCVMVIVVVSVRAQTSEDLAAKYPAVTGYEVRPGILMTAKYAEDGQVCEMVLERHYAPNQIDTNSTIPNKLEDQLIDELVPAIERGPVTSRWLRNSFIAGGVSHIERDFVNVLIEIDGTASDGDKIVMIHWKKRRCAAAKSTPVVAIKPSH
jgi:hypothetical protein